MPRAYRQASFCATTTSASKPSMNGLPSVWSVTTMPGPRSHRCCAEATPDFAVTSPLRPCFCWVPRAWARPRRRALIAEALFDGESALVRIDLSEYSEAHSIARLIGSPPGYVAHEDGGQLTEAIRRRPAAVVLLDELEKANREVLLVLLQILEDGRLTDGRGRTVDFSSAAVVMTSNLGSECYRRSRTPPASTILALARSRLPPELWNRIDEVLCYAPLSEHELGAVVARIASIRASACKPSAASLRPSTTA
jgi:hypothetical protein